MNKEGLYDINDANSLEINKEFILIDKSKWENDAYDELLNKIDNAGSIGFIINDKSNYKENEFSYVSKIYAQNNYFSDFSELKYFSNIEIENSYISNILAPGPASKLKLIGTGNTTVSNIDNKIIINTDINKEYKQLDNKINNLSYIVSDIENSYTSFSYINDNYQKIMYGGSYISINDNVISAYGLISTNDFNNIITNYYTKSETDELSNNIYDFILQGYYNKASINNIILTTKNELYNNIVGNPNESFNTLEKISTWLEPSMTFSEIKYDDLNNTDNYYIYKDNTYILAEQPYSDENNYYTKDIKDSGYILSYISYLNDSSYVLTYELGHPFGYTYIKDNKEYFTTNIPKVSINGELIDTYGNILSYSYSTGIYKIIDDTLININNNLYNLSENIYNEINKLDEKYKLITDKILYNLSAYSYTSYIDIYFTPDKYDNDPYRTLNISISEAEYDNKTDNINKNGLMTAYTTKDMIDYRLDWYVL